ncbi:mammalian cell entry protein [Nocardia yamanashiensis]|uniref:mammalian cell entry protein n=1 Tax=Nocardia yamanashiensis TaxID=209247 RepID=UPI001E2AA01F|nr:mammalian cell entry protein [Nocardia yamanashiensis]UGT38836.1 mammalian cell entry protein [Nocardia yamanashiensis]
MATTKKTSRRTGVALVAALGVLASAGAGAAALRSDDRMQVVLRTERIGDGVLTGTHVRLDGVQVGDVTGIESAGGGQQRITLRLDASQLPGLTDALSVDYAPSNLFGIGEVALRRGDGGRPLRDGATVDLTGGNATRVTDATMGALIRAVGQTTNEVLSPRLTEVLTQLATDAKAFAPIMQALVMLGRTVADTQVYAPSYLIGQYASTLRGAADFTGSTIDLLDRLNKIEVLRTQQPLFDAGVDLIANGFFPAISGVGQAGQRHLTGYSDLLVPLLDAMAQLVPTPAQSSAELRELLERVDRSFVNTPDGPVLRLEVALRGVPAVGVPLLAALGGSVASVAGPSGAPAGGER